MAQSILVLGAGELGDQVLRKLISDPRRGSTDISVLLRSSSLDSTDKSKNEQIALYGRLGIATVAGDLVNDSHEQLSSLFKQFHTVICCTGMSFPPGTQIKIAKAVLSACVKRYFPWQYGVDYDMIGRDSAQNLFTEQLDVRDLLRSQDAVQWVIVSTGMFSSFLIEPLFGIINVERNVVTAIGSWDNCITITDVSEIALVVAEIALVCPDVNGIVFTASDTVSMQDIADVADEVLGRKMERRLKTVPQLEAELSADPEDGMKKYRVVFAEGKGVSWDKSTTFNQKQGLELVPFRIWARTNLE